MNMHLVRSRGFTLVELAISIFIIALLLGSILVPLTTQVEQRQISETQKTMEEIRDALLGFAATNGYLPCPDLQVRGLAPNDGLVPSPNDGIQDPNDGIEDVTTAGAVIGACTTITGGAPNQLAAGNVPWVTLGLGNQDVWGNRFRYTILAAYAQRPAPLAPPATFSLTTAGGLRVCTTAACGTTLTATAVAVIISNGRNSRSAINALTNAATVASTSLDELENSNNNRDAVSRTHSNVAATEFDDIVIWLPKFTLNNRMVAAGQLP